MSQIKLIYNKANQKEFCLLEAQGSLETDQRGGLSGQQKFAEIERHGDKVTMVVGVHRVPGTVIALKNPLAVLKKRTDGAKAYDIEAVIKEKFLFKVRPDVVLQQEIAKLPNV
ncbi:hypothetical protein GGI25_001916 [Coemansia spiralis]|uniref:Chromosome transmission fidelity protein 8 n=2 Tax=Coemansia TaxID=4863 RepID=A0A9W8G9P6_9FUNG|nr:hypothetical protein BX070DRAFT_234862 [Coemansia spiralis]KAJ1993349.1 hypothetical protein EDC05_002213 [Coemansia umbellata]KAJ2623502.1 hypothetical protein GGI26_002341 [Coemansia sp. RSA 1358]KAJ2678927.1 hypothetical protein GGI25_001916 [Coemansia spiralis]